VREERLVFARRVCCEDLTAENINKFRRQEGMHARTSASQIPQGYGGKKKTTIKPPRSQTNGTIKIRIVESRPFA
jgi:hypothetical protein